VPPHACAKWGIRDPRPHFRVTWALRKTQYSFCCLDAGLFRLPLVVLHRLGACVVAAGTLVVAVLTASAALLVATSPSLSAT
jgi:hypothetical protein